MLMDHTDRNGVARIRKACTLALTGTNVVDMIITNLAVFERPDRRSPFRLTALAPGTDASAVRCLREAAYLQA